MLTVIVHTVIISSCGQMYGWMDERMDMSRHRDYFAAKNPFQSNAQNQNTLFDGRCLSPCQDKPWNSHQGDFSVAEKTPVA